MFHRPHLDVPDPFSSFCSTPPPTTQTSLFMTGIRRSTCATSHGGFQICRLVEPTLLTDGGERERRRHKRKVSCADLSRQGVFRRERIVSSWNQRVASKNTLNIFIDTVVGSWLSVVLLSLLKAQAMFSS